MKRPRSRSTPRVPKGKKTLGAMVRSIRVTPDTVYQFKRTCELPAWYYSALSVDTQYGDNRVSSYDNYLGYFKFKLTDLPNYTDFTNLFEAYRLKAVTLKFIPVRGTSNDVNPQVTSANTEYNAPLTPLAICVERSQINANPTFNSILEDQGAKVMLSDKVFSMYIPNPKVYGPADGLTVASLTTPWLDMATGGGAAAHHFGARFRFETNTTDSRQVAFRVFATYHIECKGAQ